jgi:cell division protein FtsW
MSHSSAMKNMALRNNSWFIDSNLLLPILILMSVGLVMVASSSLSFADYKFADPFLFVKRHIAYLVIGVAIAVISFLIKPEFWSKYSFVWLLLSFVLLIVVLIPGVGLNLNGSRRWLGVGGFTLQVSEIVKGATVIFLASQLEKHRETLSSDWLCFGKLMAVVAMLSVLLIMQPDFGTVVLLVGTYMALLFLGGSHIKQFLALLVLVLGAFFVMLISAPYRLARLTTYLDPWAQQFESGYQLTQSLIAFGRGEWFGVGLGQSVQKMLYLPDAHTDFVFAIYAEEFGFVGAVCLLALYGYFIYRIMQLGRKAIGHQHWYAAYVLIGFGLLLSGQVFINLGVNSGLLPTKGLTLPFISYGGSSLLACCGMVGMMLRLAHDLNRSKKVTSGVGHGR